MQQKKVPALQQGACTRCKATTREGDMPTWRLRCPRCCCLCRSCGAKPHLYHEWVGCVGEARSRYFHAGSCLPSMGGYLVGVGSKRQREQLRFVHEPGSCPPANKPPPAQAGRRQSGMSVPPNVLSIRHAQQRKVSLRTGTQYGVRMERQRSPSPRGSAATAPRPVPPCAHEGVPKQRQSQRCVCVWCVWGSVRCVCVVCVVCETDGVPPMSAMSVARQRPRGHERTRHAQGPACF